jgi:hypothetical protein
MKVLPVYMLRIRWAERLLIGLIILYYKACFCNLLIGSTLLYYIIYIEALDTLGLFAFRPILLYIL